MGKGKIEMTVEVLNEKDVEERPCDKGCHEPNINPKLDPPNQPQTSFWFTNPCKIMAFVVWPRFKWIFIGRIVLVFVLLFLAILFY